MRSVFFGVFQSFVVLLYILDNETNFVVQVSVFIGVLIDLWKITKVMDVRVSQAPCCCGACRLERGSPAQPGPALVSRGFPTPAWLPRPRGFLQQGIFLGHIRAGELGGVRKGRGLSDWGVAGVRSQLILTSFPVTAGPGAQSGRNLPLPNLQRQVYLH